jgi:glycosyltransferase involved in cell wall biosynthesis
VSDDHLVSVVIPAHNAAATVAQQLRALRDQHTRFPVEIVVIDNASTDDTRDIVADEARSDERIRLVSAPAGRGPSYARNIGIAAARGDLLACCDADDEVGEGWLPAMTDALLEHPYVGGPLDVDRLNDPWLADARGHWGAQAPGRFGNVDFAHGCNLGIRRELFRQVGGFDERLRAGEEIDLALRLLGLGTRLHFVPEAVVHYRYRTTLRANCKQSFSFGRVAPVLERRANALSEYVPEGMTARRAAWLVPNVVRLATRTGRVRWTWVAAGLCGRAAGTLRAVAT